MYDILLFITQRTKHRYGKTVRENTYTYKKLKITAVALKSFSLLKTAPPYVQRNNRILIKVKYMIKCILKSFSKRSTDNAKAFDKFEWCSSACGHCAVK